MILPRPSKAVQVYMVLDVIQSLVTAGLCANVILKKGRARSTRFIMLRRPNTFALHLDDLSI